MHFVHALLMVALMACLVLAHPGKKHHPGQLKREIAAQKAWAAHGKRSLSACARSESARSLQSRNIKRRELKLRELREKVANSDKHRVNRRTAEDLAKWEAVSHNKTGISSPEALFNAETSCILAPVITDGPYYVWGELVRQNVVEDICSQGVPMHLEVQYIDVNTCEPLPDLFVDIWNANATGVYSGISEEGNYAVDGWNSTYLRGIQPTDKDGVAVFDTIFPGHYSGRATHTHLLVHSNATLLPNGTLLVNTGSITHNGQLFYNEKLRSAVEASYPYNTNTVAVTSNAEDQWAKLQADSEYDPFVEYSYVGDDISNGLYAWKQIGINSTANYINNSYYAIAGYIQADGGFENTGAHKFSPGK
ncbi:uncharacterized protein N7484_005281 [Penicillium longicatenatum]|uniref:uncharacterized protein n=1 Tax=Penicillium longicatenatum TaxID=1561947 RepID=UPI002546F36C|nr:uncharacterized protein N7484_005281 [Penicillium longicatenatum]KAJ5651558.1 hypothetical protein N7484_005281 [Penicillium longicatenatum]